MAEVRVVADTVSVHLPVFNINSLSLKKTLLRLGTSGRIQHSSKCLFVEALRGVSFAIEDGDRVGVIGLNGAGKTTLLRTIAGIFQPTAGRMRVTGGVTPLLAVGVGMYDDASGWENIRNGALQLGMRVEEVERKADDIARFTELGDYLHLPLYTYSAGMRMRLSFAIATAIEAEILALDEVTSVGDAHFVAKCADRFTHMLGRTRIVVMASHDPGWVRRFCNKALLLSDGRVADYGPTESVLGAYERSVG